MTRLTVFCAAYGRAQILGLIPLLMVLFANEGSATAFSMGMGQLLWSVGSAIYAFCEAGDAKVGGAA